MLNTSIRTHTFPTSYMTKNVIPFNRILVVDDSDVDFFIASTHIQRHKPSAKLIFADSVDKALDMLRNCNPADVPDLILLDLNFDRQTKQGIDFLNEFWKQKKTYPQEVKVMVLTAFAGFEELCPIQKMFPETEILQKPFSLEKLGIC